MNQYKCPQFEFHTPAWLSNCGLRELVHLRRFATRAESEAANQEYIEISYHRQRRHSRLR